MKTFLITGAAQGFGLELAKALLDADASHQVVLAVRRPDVAPQLGPRSRVVKLDLSTLAEVEAFAREWKEPLTALINNAGVQNREGLRRTPDGLEETVAVNYLAAVHLTQLMLPQLKGGRVLFIGSETHIDKFVLRMMGFRGARYRTLEASLQGEPELSGPDRYATSKMLDTLAAMAFARHEREVTFLTFDPGMMAGTGLARDTGALGRWVWKHVLPWLAPLLMPGASRLARSAQAGVWLLTSGEPKSGEAWNYERKPAPLGPELHDEAFIDRVWAETRARLSW